jgi:hypothetical protein
MEVSIDTLIADESDAKTEFDRRLAQRSRRTISFSVECLGLLTDLKLGDNINITYPKFGIISMTCAITGITLDPNTNITSLSLWAPAKEINALFTYVEYPNWGAHIKFRIDLSGFDFDITDMARALGFSSPALAVHDAISVNSLLQITIGTNVFDEEHEESFADVNLVKMVTSDDIYYQGLSDAPYSSAVITNVDIENKIIEGSFYTYAYYRFYPPSVIVDYFEIPPSGREDHGDFYGWWSNPVPLNPKDEYDYYRWNLSYHTTMTVPPYTTTDFANDGEENYRRGGNRIRCEDGKMSPRLYFKYLNSSGVQVWNISENDGHKGFPIAEVGNFDFPTFVSNYD